MLPSCLAVAGCSFPTVNVVVVGDDAASPGDAASLTPDLDAAPSSSDGSFVDAADPDAAPADAGADAPLGIDAQPLDSGVPRDATPPGDGAPGVDCACSPLQMYPTNVNGCGLLNTGIAACMPGGFTGNPACGTEGPFITCASNGLVCQATTITKVQQCM